MDIALVFLAILSGLAAIGLGGAKVLLRQDGPGHPIYRDMRILALAALVFSILFAGAALADETPPLRFAPGALRDLPPLDRLHHEGEQGGAALKDLPDVDDSALGDLDIRAILERGRAMAPRTGLPMSPAPEGALAPKPLILVFASLSLPDRAFRAMSQDAERAGALVLLRGFIDNSVAATYKRLGGIFEASPSAADLLARASEIPPFAIDPRMFRLFDVQAVPTVVALNAPVPDCASRFCGAEPVPAHSRVAGNGRLHAALQLIAGSDGPGARAAADGLSRLGSSPVDGQ